MKNLNLVDLQQNSLLEKKFCCNCRMKIMQILDASEQAISSSDSRIESLELEMVRDNLLMTLNESFQNLGESPIKLQGITCEELY